VYFTPPKKADTCDSAGGALPRGRMILKARSRTGSRSTRRHRGPLIDYYAKTGLLKNIEAEKGIEEILVVLKNAF